MIINENIATKTALHLLQINAIKVFCEEIVQMLKKILKVHLL